MLRVGGPTWVEYQRSAMPLARLRPISSHVAAVDLHGRFQVAVFLVRHRGGLALVDAGFPRWHYAVLTAAQSLPAPNEITHVILTHAHVDHIGGASGILDHMPAQVLCSVAERPFIEGRSLASSATGMLSRVVLTLNHHLALRRVEPVRIDGTLREGDEICGLRVIEVPGHTPGQIALIHVEDRVVLCADALFNVKQCVGHDPIPGITADRALAEASMQRIAELGIADVIPSHGPAILGEGPEQIRRFLESRSR